MSIYYNHFLQADSSYLLFENNVLIDANPAACALMNTEKEGLLNTRFSDLFKDVAQSENAVIQTIEVSGSKRFSVVSRKIVLSPNQFAIRLRQPLLEIGSLTDSESVADTNRFRQLISNMHEITVELNRCSTIDEIYKQAIVLGKNRLDIERLAILLIDAEKKEQYGTWGVNEKGELTDEHAWQSTMENTPWIEKALKEPNFCYFWDDIDLINWGEVVGRGWSALANLGEESRLFGWLVADNLITKKPLTPATREIFRLYAVSLGQIITRKQSELELKRVNENLEQMVDEKTTEIENKLAQLQFMQRELIEQEKHAALGNLVVGVSHEINTPLGNALMAVSQLEHIDASLFKAQTLGQLTKGLLTDSLAEMTEATDLLNRNLNRAVGLVRSFKQLAVDQTDDQIMSINLHDMINNVFNSYYHQYKNRNIQCVNEVDSQLQFFAPSGKLLQVITKLFENGLIHAFSSEQAKDRNGRIGFTANLDNEQLTFSYADNGDGIAPDLQNRIFEPMFTTERGRRKGMGLSLVQKIIVSEMNGALECRQLKPHGVRFQMVIDVISD